MKDTAPLRVRLLMLRPLSLRLVAALAVAAGGFAGGCATTHQVWVEASVGANARAVRGASYHLIDYAVRDGGSALRQKEIAAQVRTALAARGLYEARDAAAADFVVEIDYGLGPPRTTRKVYQELVFGRPVPASEGPRPAPEGVAREMMGYAPMANIAERREKHLLVSVRENRSRAKAAAPTELWRVRVGIESEGEDLRGHLPLLMTAAMEQLGRESDGAMTIALRDDDAAVELVRAAQ